VNAWSEIAAMVAALINAYVFRRYIYGSEAAFNEHGVEVLAWSAAIVTAVWLIVTLLTPAGDEAKLKAFYRRVRPAGPFWGPIARAVAAEGDAPIAPGYSLTRALVCWLAGIAMVYCTLFGTGKLLLGEPMAGIVLLGAAVIAITILREMLRRHTEAVEPPTALPVIMETT
jgi:hypothetical protein